MEYLPKHITTLALAGLPEAHRDCPVCLELMTETSVLGTLCGHLYCSRCIIKLSTCAICRKILTPAVCPAGFHPDAAERHERLAQRENELIARRNEERYERPQWLVQRDNERTRAAWGVVRDWDALIEQWDQQRRRVPGLRFSSTPLYNGTQRR